MDAAVYKTCFKCSESKPLHAFHKHKRMSDGHLNKCAVCTVKDVAEWRLRQPSGVRNREYELRIARGKVTRVKARKIDGVSIGQDPECRRRSSLKYQQKRHGRVRILDELTEFAFYEARALAVLRASITKTKWSIDHIVPLRHRLASGLHVAANFQVVPALWNSKKNNSNMSRYFGN